MKRHASMNRVYRLVWSQVLNAWVAVREHARGRGKESSRTLVAAALSLSAALVQAAPIGGQVASGAGSISQSGATTTITQSSQNLSLNWQSFNIARPETVNFVQPSTSAIAVNRISDTSGTQILGHLNANGQVYLINPNGILFGQGAQVNVGGLVASTLDLNDAFLNGATRTFAGPGTGSVVNQGTITATNGGYVALLGNRVSNQGTITAQLGTVALGAGSAATLTFSGNSLVQMQVDQSTLNNLAENKQLIQADGGMVIMSAGAKDALLASVVNNTGVIEARTVENRDGSIILLGGMQAGQVNVGGTLDVSSATGTGGHVLATADHVVVTDNTLINATGATGGGTINIGGGWQGSGGIPQATAIYIAKTATLDASATDHGNGGTVVAWSDIHNPSSATRAYGTFLTKGGANGGNGGRIETSGHWLDVAGIAANASAPMGQGGEWLLDPYDLTITSTATTATTAGGPPYSFSSGSGATNVLNTDIQTQLNNGTSVTLQTTGTSGDGFGSGNITVSANIAKTAGGNANLLLKAHNDIVVATGVSVSSTAGALNVTLNSDSDGSGAGAIVMNSGSSITSNGGNITLGGGSAGDGSGRAFGSAGKNDGILINGANLSSAGGNIVLRGKSANVGGFAAGIRINNDNTADSMINSGSGTILLDGISQGSSAVAGVEFNTNTQNHKATITSANTTANAITINADASPASVAGWGLLAYWDTTISATGAGGGVTITGKINNIAGGRAIGFHSPTYAGGRILANGGPIVLNAITAGSGTSIYANGLGQVIGQLAGSTVPTSSSNITLNIDRPMEGSSANLPLFLIDSTGVLTIQPNTAATTIGIAGGAGTVSLLASLFNGGVFSNHLSSITVGNATAGKITVGGATTFGTNTTLMSGSGGIAISGAITATGKNLTLSTTGSASESSSITAAGLELLGSGGSYTLTNAANSIATLAGNTGSISLVDNASLAVGTVNTAGITTSGAVSLQATGASSDITLNQSVTGGGSGNSVVLSVGRNFINNAGSGGVNPGAGGGRWLIYSAAPANDTFGALASNSLPLWNKTYTSYAPASVTETGNRYLFSYQPSLTATVNGGNIVKAYGTDLTASAPTTTITGLVNATTYGGAFTQEAYTGTGAASTNGLAGTALISGSPYTLTVSGNLAAPTGYGTSTYNDVSLTINKAALTVTANAASKTYDGLAYSGSNGLTYTGFVNGETSAALGGTLIYSGSSQGAVNAGSYAITPSGLTSGNYTLSYSNGTLTVNPVTLTYSATSAGFIAGQTPAGMSGTVNGFVAGETLASSTTGTLAWTSTAGASSQPGQYSINGGGLVAPNYVFAQNASNATALTLKPGTAPEPVRNATAQMQSNVLSFQTGAQPQTLSLSPTITVTQSSSADSIARSDSSASGSGNNAMVNATMNIGGSGPTLHIVNGGMRLPDTIVSTN